jgi:hypothetical protein
MNWEVWDKVEALLDDAGIRPIVAVIPNNRDPQMMISAPRADFWQRVRGWQARGWTIGLHGDDHGYITAEAGMIGLNRRSEFAGLPFAEQEAKIVRGLAKFAAEGAKADLFVAPSHSFDRITLEALSLHGVDVVSDGFYLRPVRRFGMTFVPQQLWRFRPVPFGLWTVCFHHNDFTAEDIDMLARDIRTYRDRIVSVDDVLAETHRYGILDRLCPPAWHASKMIARARTALREAIAGQPHTAKAT